MEGYGENPVFWVDLSTAALIEGSFTSASETLYPVSVTLTTSPTMNQWLPAAKLGGGNYIYVFSGGTYSCCSYWTSSGINYFGIAAVSEIYGTNGGGSEGLIGTSAPGLTVQQAFAIDTKVDDGLPQTGRVTAQYIASSGYDQTFVGASGTSATSGSATTCYDNGNVAGATQQYSMEQNNGTGVNCALSFQMQGAAR